MNKHFLYGLLLAGTSLFACGKDDAVKQETEEIFPEVTDVIKGWNICNDFGDLPSYLYVYKSPEQILNKKVKAFIVVADLNKGALFNVIGEKSGLSTPKSYYENNDKPAVIMNAGYFTSSGSLSLICRDNEVLCPNIQVVTRSNGSTNMPFYPTRSIFSYKGNGKYAAEWVYTNNGLTYSYPRPAANKAGTTPLQQPSATFPIGATAWMAQTAVGGGPVLLKGSAIMNTWEAELCDAASGIGPTANNPRSAIGITRYNHLVFFVCEGRNMTPEVPGLTLEEVAQILKDLGCVDAINLDGGGSSCMLINGQETIKPSDKTQRSVSSCVVMK